MLPNSELRAIFTSVKIWPGVTVTAVRFAAKSGADASTVKVP
jgi:hypothetical protein